MAERVLVSGASGFIASHTIEMLLEQGFEVYFITDASGGMTKEIHDAAIDRMTAAGAVPITSMQYLLELQRDWARSETYAVTNDIVMQHGGAYGLGVLYAKDMFGGGEGD